MAFNSLAAFALKHPLGCLNMHAGPRPVKAVRRDAGCHDDSFIKGPRLIITTSGHSETWEMCLLYENSMRSDLSRIPTALHSGECDFSLQSSEQSRFHPPGVSELA